VAVLFGMKSSVVLRKVDEHYVIVGVCFVLGLMYGEAMKTYEGAIQDFEIR
jgi:uncharacterized membrane protein YuzA (DUF378 family)